MSSLWARLEPLLARVQKPARYIGCEDGAATPRHDKHRVAWLLAYPDTYEIGLPNQGLQILYEILNERDDAVAERTYAPWRDLDALLRERGRAAVLGRHPPCRRRLRHVRVQPVGRARLHERAEHDRPRRHPGAVSRPSTRAPAGRDRRPLPRSTPSRSPTSSTWPCSATAKRSSARSPTSSATGRRPAGRLASRCCASSPDVPGVYVPSMYDVEYDGARLVVDRAPLRRRARHRRQAHRRRSRRVAVPEATPSCRSPRSSTTG